MRISDWSSDVCSSDLSRKWRVDRDLSITPAERQALQREWATAKQRRAEERARSEAEAAKDAAEMWEEAGPACAVNAYVVKIGISPNHFRPSAGKVLFTMFDRGGPRRNLTRQRASGATRVPEG